MSDVPTSAVSRSLRLTPLIALLATIALVYWPGLGGGFVFDDYPNIVNNPGLHVSTLAWRDWIGAMLSSPATALQRPLVMLTFALNYYFTGLDPVPMKLTNIMIHLVNTLLVFGLARSLLRAATPADATGGRRNDWAALFTAACWGLHPINLMAVLFVVQRMESLCHLFVFAGLWLYVAGRLRQHAGRRGWGLVLCGLIPFTAFGLLAKESAALLPLYALCIELCVFRFRGRDQLLDRRLAGVFVVVLVLPALIGVAWLLPRSLGPAAFSYRDFTLGERLLTEPRVVLEYLRWTFLPDLGQLSLSHDDYSISRSLWDPPTTIAGLVAVPALLVVAWLCRRRRPLVSLGLLWFLGAQLLTATIVPLELVFEHRNYFASLGICLLLADVLVCAPRPGSARIVGCTAALAYILACGGLTYLRASEWSSPLSFAIAEGAKHPQSPRATYYLGWMLAESTRYRADSPLLTPAFEALERARQVPNSNILADQAELILAARTGVPLQAAWWQHMQTRLRTHPIGPQELGALGALVTCSIEQHCRFPPDDMLETFAAALSRGDNADLMLIYGNYALNELGDSTLTLRLWQEACRLNPKEPQYLISLAKLLIELGRYEEAQLPIANLRKLGRFGQYDSAADALLERLHTAAKAPHYLPQNK